MGSRRTEKDGMYCNPGQGEEHRGSALDKPAVTATRAEQVPSTSSSADSSLGLFSCNLGGILTDWDTGAQRMYGYTAGEAIGNPIGMLVPDSNADEIPAILNEVARGKYLDHYQT